MAIRSTVSRRNVIGSRTSSVFPGEVVGSGGITIEKSGNVTTIGFDLSTTELEAELQDGIALAAASADAAAASAAEAASSLEHIEAKSVAIAPDNEGTGLAIWPQTASGIYSSDYWYNYILVGPDTTNIASGYKTYGLAVELDTGGTATGQKFALGAIGVLNVAGDTGGDLLGLSSVAYATVNNGGTDTGSGAKGSLYGAEHIGHAASGSTNYLIVSGCEAQAIIATGATAKHRWGIDIISGGDVNGVTTDTAIEIAANGGSVSWLNGIMLTNTHGAAPLATTGTVIGTDGSSVTATNFASLPTYTFTGNLFDFGTPFVMSGDGGTVLGGATGGNKGAGTINAKAVYDDNSLLTCPAAAPEFIQHQTVDVRKWDDLTKRKHFAARRLEALVDAGYDFRKADDHVRYTDEHEAIPGMPTQAEWEHSKFSLGELQSCAWLAKELQALAMRDILSRVRKLEEK